MTELTVIEGDNMSGKKIVQGLREALDHAKTEAEAARFEEWARSRHLSTARKPESEWGDHRYFYEHIEAMWLGWKSRAALET